MHYFRVLFFFVMFSDQVFVIVPGLRGWLDAVFATKEWCWSLLEFVSTQNLFGGELRDSSLGSALCFPRR